MSWTANVMNLALVASVWLLADWLSTRQAAQARSPALSAT
jgi:hypothetical protein